MSWSDVGSWIKDNAGSGAALVGSLLTGNIPGAIAAGVSLVSGATGTDDPVKALSALQSDPETMIKLKELAIQDEENIRNHIREMKRLELEDEQKSHEQTQMTIRGGDNAEDEYVRHTRPMMARQSWYATMLYCLVSGGAKIADIDIFNVYLAGTLAAPAMAYIGFRTGDKFAGMLDNRKDNK